MKQIIISVMALLLLAAPSFASVWQKAVAQVEAGMKQARSDARTTQEIIAGEGAALSGELSKLSADVGRSEAALKALKEKFDGLLQTEERLRREIEAEEDQIQALAETLRTAGKDAEGMIGASIITPEMPARQVQLKPLLDPERFPGMEDIEALADVLLTEMAASGQVLRRTGTFVDAEGAEARGEILRVGKFTTFYKQGEAVGYLRSDRNTGRPVAIPGCLPRSVRNTISDYFAGEARHLPLDLTGGIIVEQVSRSDGIREWLAAGGLLVWPILLIGAVALLLSLERLWSLGSIPTRTDGLMERLRDLVSRGDLSACQALCEKKEAVPTCKVLKTGLAYAGEAKEVMENALEEAILGELPRLERFLSTLSVLAAVAPLLGLLGTVTGMIHTFQGITVFGTSDPRMMSGGISEALVTTQLGLAVAIPITIIHHFFDRRVEKIIGDMEEKGTALVTVLIRNGI